MTKLSAPIALKVVDDLDSSNNITYDINYSSETEPRTEEKPKDELKSNEESKKENGYERSKERSRIRKKYILESLTQSEKECREENLKLKSTIKKNLSPAIADKLIRRSETKTIEKTSSKSKSKRIAQLQNVVKALKEENTKLSQAIKGYIGGNAVERSKQLKKTVSWNLPKDTKFTHYDKQEYIYDDNSKESEVTSYSVENKPKTAKLIAFRLPKGSEDSKFLEELQAGDQNFCVTDPNLPDNPIVYASKGFLELTKYSLDDILGRNCRFLQGPRTSPSDIAKIREAIKTGESLSMCLLNYKADGTTFWNLFHISALRDAKGEIINFIGIQCKVDEEYAEVARKNDEISF